jgi:hypothetical protein
MLELVKPITSPTFGILVVALHSQPSSPDAANSAAWIAAGFSVPTLIVTTGMPVTSASAGSAGKPDL